MALTSGQLFNSIDGQTVQFFEKRFTLGEELVWEMAIEKDLCAGPAQDRDGD